MTTQTDAITADIALIDEAHDLAAKAYDLFELANRTVHSAATEGEDDGAPGYADPTLDQQAHAALRALKAWIDAEQKMRTDLRLRRQTIEAEAADGEYGDI